jgi:PAS domain S-box-containing protein
LILVTGSLLYVLVKLAVSVVRETSAVFVVTRLNPLGAGLASVGFFLLVMEYTGVENPVSKRTITGVVFVPVVISVLALIDPEYLWVRVGTDASTLSGYAWDVTSVSLGHQLYMSLLLLAGIGLLVRRETPSSNMFTVQVWALVFAALGPIVGNLAFQFGYIPFNLAPVMFVASGALIAWAILRAGFLDLIPIGRDTVLDQFDAGVVTLDEDHRVIDINERGRQLFGVDEADTVVGDHVDELFADHPSFGDLYWTVTAGDSEQDPLIEVDGAYYTVEVVLLGPSEEIILGRTIIIRDITEQKERERALKQARRELRQIVDLIPDPLYAKNSDDVVLLSNEANAELHGLRPEQIEGEREREFIRGVENIGSYDMYRQREIEVMESGEPTVFEEELEGPDGKEHVFKITRIPFETAGSDEDAVLGYARDVTDIKEYERELEETKRTLKQSNEKLDRFASTVSHDLRNPLNVARGRLELARMETESEHLVAVDEAHERIEALIEDLLALARQGDMIAETDAVDLARLAETTWRNVATAEATLTVETERMIHADTSRLTELLENLFRNAVEHAGEDVTITVGELADGFYVADDGPGVPVAKRGEVFDAGYSTADDGTGFGLNIVREIAEAHAWEVRVTDSESGGARFEITGVKI